MTLLHQHASPKALHAIRLMVFGLWFVSVARDPLEPISWLPLSVFEPAGVLAMLPVGMRSWLLQPGFLLGLKVLTAASLGAVLLNGGRTLAVLACVCLTVQQGITRGFAGHIDHKDLVLLYAAYLLAALPLADGLVKQDRSASHSRSYTLSGIPLVAILTTLGVTYTLVGVHRLVHGGLEVFTSGSLTFWALRDSYQVLHPAWGLGRFLLQQRTLNVLLNMGFPIVTVFEVLAPLCLVSRTFRAAFLVVMVPFHLFSWIFMEVFFWKNLALYVLCVDWSRVKARVT